MKNYILGLCCIRSTIHGLLRVIIISYQSLYKTIKNNDANSIKLSQQTFKNHNLYLLQSLRDYKRLKPSNIRLHRLKCNVIIRLEIKIIKQKAISCDTLYVIRITYLYCTVSVTN